MNARVMWVLIVGLNSLVTLSNGEKIEPPKFLRKMEKKLIREQRRLSRKKKWLREPTQTGNQARSYPSKDPATKIRLQS